MFVRTLTALAVALLLGSAVRAQPSGGFGGGFDDPFGVAGPGGSSPVTVLIEPSSRQVAPGGKVLIAVTLDLKDGWHIYPQEVPTPEELGGVFATPTDVFASADPVGDVAEPVRFLRTQWPDVHHVEVALDPNEPAVRVPVFESKSVVYLSGVVSPDLAVGSTVSVFVDVSYQACDATSCLPPDGSSETLTFEVVAEAPEIAADGVFDGFDASVFDSAAAAIPQATKADDSESAGVGATPRETVTGSSGSGRTFFGVVVPQGDGAGGILLLAGLAAVGGFILNLTPCVLPVIPIKIMTISKHAESHGKGALLGLAMALGVVAFWAGIGLPVAFLTGVTDPSRIFGYWYVTLGIGIVIAAMGVGIMGLFTINLPKQVYMVNPQADSLWGSFVFGIMTAVLGLPCFGFVAGALLAGAATLPPAVIMVIFTALGVGMALPYLVLSMFPKLVEKLPRTGPASELVKQVMGLLLIAAAAYFIGAGLIGLVSEQPYLGKQLHWWVIAICATLAGFWLVLRTFQITRKPAPRVVFSFVGLVISGIAILYALDTTHKAKSIYEAKAEAEARQSASGELITNTWIDYTDVNYERAKDSGRVVVRDFTAEWCLNCKALKAAVLNREPVKSGLAADDIVTFTVDLTSRKAPGWVALKDLGETGIPLLTVEGPGIDGVWKANAYTAEQVLEAIERARGAFQSSQAESSAQTIAAQD